MSIIGQGLDRFVEGQIKTRQKVYGSINRSPEELLYLNSRTSFVKAISSVNITSNYNPGPDRPELTSILKEYSGNRLASNFILFNGTTPSPSNQPSSRKAGIPTSLLGEPDLYINNFAYGLGGLEYGARPMPGIFSMTNKSEGNGSLETTTLQIKAWNRVQFEIIDLLYLRLGYGVLVEWGNTSYFNNRGIYQSDNSYSLEAEFLRGDYDANQLLDKIQTYRIQSNGNYDAIFGKVVNFNWSFAEDGSYDITVILRSLGDVIESLKMNVLNEDTDVVDTGELTPKYFTTELSQSFENQRTAEQDATYVAPSVNPTTLAAIQNSQRTSAISPSLEEITIEDTIDDSKDKHSLARLFYNTRKIFGTKLNPNNSDIGLKYDESSTSTSYTPPTTQGEKSNLIQFISQVFKMTGGENELINTQYYIRLGSLLAFIEKNIIPKYNPNSPILKIDYNPETNLIYYNDFQVSADPRICLIKTEQIDETGASYKFASLGEDYVLTTSSGVKVGKAMNIYVNFEHILRIIDGEGDPKNPTTLVDFLTTLYHDISIALGSINTLRPWVDYRTNTLKLIDETSLANKGDILTLLRLNSPDQDEPLQIYGYNFTRNNNGILTNSIAGFVRNFSLKSSLDPRFASIITIGAQARGAVVGEDATALSKLNQGLIDRIKPEIINPVPTPEESISELNRVFSKAFPDYLKFIRQLGSNPTKASPELNTQLIDSYSNLLATFLLYIESRSAILNSSDKNISGTIGFIPVNLNLTLDGISGLKIYNSIKVETKYLPSNYPETMEFIISGLSHTVINNVWTTSLDTIMVPNSRKVSWGKIDRNFIFESTLTSIQIYTGNVPSTEEQSAIAIQIISYFVSKGLTPAQAAGIVGNWYAESRLNKDAINSASGAYGLGQWLGPRKTRLINFASQRGESLGNISIQTQLDYTQFEFENFETRAYNLLKQYGTEESGTSETQVGAQLATVTFALEWERMSEIEYNLSKKTRISYSIKFLSDYLNSLKITPVPTLTTQIGGVGFNF
jgi:hypothetical protein